MSRSQHNIRAGAQSAPQDTIEGGGRGGPVDVTRPSLPVARDWDHPAVGAFAESGLLLRAARPLTVVDHARGRLAYLATPYSKEVVLFNGAFHPDLSVHQSACAALWMAELARQGVTAVSPIVLAHEMVMADGGAQLDPLDAGFWTRWCRPLLAACDLVIVPPIDGWRDSDGIWHEVRATLAVNKRVILIAGPEGGAA